MFLATEVDGIDSSVQGGPKETKPYGIRISSLVPKLSRLEAPQHIVHDILEIESMVLAAIPASTKRTVGDGDSDCAPHLDGDGRGVSAPTKMPCVLFKNGNPEIRE